MPKKKTIKITEVLSSLIASIVKHTPTFSHIDISALMVCVASNRSGRGGAFGKLIPMRFENGSRFIRFKKRLYAMPEIMTNDLQCLYIIYFYMPKFFNLNPLDKLNVVFHELYHISPEFNGDIRRIALKRKAHGGSRKRYDSMYFSEFEAYANSHVFSEFYDFLSMDSKSLFDSFDRVYANRMPVPKPVSIS
jgi:predicted metallopeptidase